MMTKMRVDYSEYGVGADYDDENYISPALLILILRFWEERRFNCQLLHSDDFSVLNVTSFFDTFVNGHKGDMGFVDDYYHFSD